MVAKHKTVNDMQTLIHTARNREEIENFISNIHQWVAAEEENKYKRYTKISDKEASPYTSVSPKF